MTIAFVREVGTAASSSNGTSLVVTCSATSIVGNHLILCAVGSLGVTGVTDSKGNTWQVDLVTAASGAFIGSTVSCRITTQLVSSDTITVTFATGNTGRAVSVAEYSGLAASAWLDKTASAGSGGATATASDSGATATTSQAAELLIGVRAAGTASVSTVTPEVVSPVWNLNSVATSSGQAKDVNPMYRVMAATGTYSAKTTWVTSRAWTQSILTYKAAAVAAGSSQAVVVA